MLFSCRLLDEGVLKIRSSSHYRQRAPWGIGKTARSLIMKGYTFFLAAAFLLTTTGAALAQNNLQSTTQRVEATPSTGTVSGAVQQSTVNTGKSGQK